MSGMRTTYMDADERRAYIETAKKDYLYAIIFISGMVCGMTLALVSYWIS